MARPPHTAALMAVLVVALGAAEECGSSGGGGGPQNACSAWILQAPLSAQLEGGVLVEAVVAAECRERQVRHAVHVDLYLQDEQGRWIQVRTLVETEPPTPGRQMKIPISATDCVDGRWRVRFYVVGTTKAGAKYRYPKTGMESKVKRVRCG
ncbi:hypothetical protein GCM10009678_30470 [Actinomadura kijaniata]|uniref:Uncharacterized protein n=1 Tax=Actinomadura namibiensis TaxID=182080 RepID=A0A7W3QLY6_ACTNM|nr:hypothetical protein [Actinomadura namibiensis]MBA8951987.1 hypothetical protein [Actinomadura namibiensis]